MLYYFYQQMSSNHFFSFLETASVSQPEVRQVSQSFFLIRTYMRNVYTSCYKNTSLRHCVILTCPWVLDSIGDTRQVPAWAVDRQLFCGGPWSSSCSSILPSVAGWGGGIQRSHHSTSAALGTHGGRLPLVADVHGQRQHHGEAEEKRVERGHLERRCSRRWL